MRDHRIDEFEPDLFHAEKNEMAGLGLAVGMIVWPIVFGLLWFFGYM